MSHIVKLFMKTKEFDLQQDVYPKGNSTKPGYSQPLAQPEDYSESLFKGSFTVLFRLAAPSLLLSAHSLCLSTNSCHVQGNPAHLTIATPISWRVLQAKTAR